MDSNRSEWRKEYSEKWIVHLLRAVTLNPLQPWADDALIAEHQGFIIEEELVGTKKLESRVLSVRT